MEILDEARDKVSLGMVTGGADTSRGVSAGWFKNYKKESLVAGFF
jgi:hypothetical protein